MKVSQAFEMPSEKDINVDSTAAGMSKDTEIAQVVQIEELRREFSIWSLGSLCLWLMGTWEALASVIAAALTNGGAPCLFYN
jgi:choline transport protein